MYNIEYANSYLISIDYACKDKNKVETSDYSYSNSCVTHESGLEDKTTFTMSMFLDVNDNIVLLDKPGALNK